jgi:hypothetical protein
VSAHIFDLAPSELERWSTAERLSMAFAAALGYRRGGRDPNATAIFSRMRPDTITERPALEHFDTLALEVGLAFLGFETKTFFRCCRGAGEAGGPPGRRPWSPGPGAAQALQRSPRPSRGPPAWGRVGRAPEKASTWATGSTSRWSDRRDVGPVMRSGGSVRRWVSGMCPTMR